MNGKRQQDPGYAPGSPSPFRTHLSAVAGLVTCNTHLSGCLALSGLVTCNTYLAAYSIGCTDRNIRSNSFFRVSYTMDKITFNQYPQFFTVTILEWKHLLEDDCMKDIIIESLRFLVKDGRVIVYGFVIMPNHIHLIWQIQDKSLKNKVQQNFLKFTAQKMKFRLIDTGSKALESYRVIASDREYQFWERNPLSIDLWRRPVFIQKLNYMHNNPAQAHWKLCTFPEEYKYSSFRFYKLGVLQFEFLTHYQG
jgi:putative transposase